MCIKCGENCSNTIRCPGPKGCPGEKGERGKRGHQGETGPTGATGPLPFGVFNRSVTSTPSANRPLIVIPLTPGKLYAVNATIVGQSVGGAVSASYVITWTFNSTLPILNTFTASTFGGPFSTPPTPIIGNPPIFLVLVGDNSLDVDWSTTYTLVET